MAQPSRDPSMAYMPRIMSSSCGPRQRIPTGLLLLIAAVPPGVYLLWRRSRRDDTTPAADPAVVEGMRFEVHTVDMPNPSSQVTP
jgi:hypothetical protein